MIQDPETITSNRSWKQHLVVQSFTKAIRLTGYTSAEIHINREPLASLNNHYILSTWHENIYFSCWLLRNSHYGSMISNSKDGEFIANVMEKFSFVPIRGSSSKGGSRALRAMIKYLKDGLPVAITPDGPKGPRYKVQSGVIILARMTGAPIIPWCYEASDQVIMQKSWDHHKIPKPFTIAVSRFGEPFYVPPKLSSEETEDYCRKLEIAMQSNQQQALEELRRLQSAGANQFFKKMGIIMKQKIPSSR